MSLPPLNSAQRRAFGAAQRTMVMSAFEDIRKAVCALSIGDIDERDRGGALQLLAEVYDMLDHGLRLREVEREQEEDARIIKAYREGRLVETPNLESANAAPAR